MKTIVINGGKKLTGEVGVSGAKNAALPILAAGLLCPGKHTISNVPRLADVTTLGRILQNMGVSFERKDHDIVLDSTALSKPEAPYDLVRTMRASVLVLGPLVARMGRARVSLPGGCAIGARPINLHLMGLEKLGASVKIEHGYVVASAKKLRGARICFDTVTVTGTENLMMAAALAQGETVLENAAREPEVIDLANALIQMGARIEGAGSDIVTIRGVERLRPMNYTVMPDRIETGTFVMAAAITGGSVLIKSCNPAHLDAVLAKAVEAGAEITVSDNTIRVTGPRTIKPVNVKTLEYPGFPTDMQAQIMSLMTLGGRDECHQRDHLRKPLHPRRRTPADGRRNRGRRPHRRRQGRFEAFGCAGDGDGPPGERIAHPRGTGGGRPDCDLTHLPSRPGIRGHRGEAFRARSGHQESVRIVTTDEHGLNLQKDFFPIFRVVRVHPWLNIKK